MQLSEFRNCQVVLSGCKRNQRRLISRSVVEWVQLDGDFVFSDSLFAPAECLQQGGVLNETFFTTAVQPNCIQVFSFGLTPVPLACSQQGQHEMSATKRWLKLERPGRSSLRSRECLNSGGTVGVCVSQLKVAHRKFGIGGAGNLVLL